MSGEKSMRRTLQKIALHCEEFISGDSGYYAGDLAQEILALSNEALRRGTIKQRHSPKRRRR